MWFNMYYFIIKNNNIYIFLNIKVLENKFSKKYGMQI